MNKKNKIENLFFLLFLLFLVLVLFVLLVLFLPFLRQVARAEEEILKQLQDLRSRVEKIENKTKDLPMIVDATGILKEKERGKSIAHSVEETKNR